MFEMASLNSSIIEFIRYAGPWFYVALFAIIFAENGIIFGILLPGDSLLFALGVVAAITGSHVHLAVFTIFIGAVAGDSFNYFTGKFVGEKVFNDDARFFKTAYLEKTKKLLEKHGTKAIVFSRFIAFARTITPFVAGASQMKYSKFVMLGVLSAALWSSSITYTAYMFGTNKFIKNNLGSLILIVIALVLIHNITTYILKRKSKIRTN